MVNRPRFPSMPSLGPHVRPSPGGAPGLVPEEEPTGGSVPVLLPWQVVCAQQSVLHWAASENRRCLGGVRHLAAGFKIVFLRCFWSG